MTAPATTTSPAIFVASGQKSRSQPFDVYLRIRSKIMTEKKRKIHKKVLVFCSNIIVISKT